MDAPKGRYSVVEKDGRLVVIDNGTGTPIPSTLTPPRGRSGGLSAAPVEPAPPGPVDRAARALLRLAVRRWDAEGRAVIAWQWEQNGRAKRWDALLDERQQRRLGRALLATASPPALILLLFLIDEGVGALAMLVAILPLFWGFLALQRLYRETNDPSSIR